MIDENLCRAELTPSDRAAQTARRKAIYIELHPETAHGGGRVKSQSLRLDSDAERFTAETAKATGQSERTVQLNAERGEKAIYIELHPETINGVNQHSSLRQLGEPSERFTADTAKATGQSERTARAMLSRKP